MHFPEVTNLSNSWLANVIAGTTEMLEGVYWKLFKLNFLKV